MPEEEGHPNIIDIGKFEERRKYIIESSRRRGAEVRRRAEQIASSQAGVIFTQALEAESRGDLDEAARLYHNVLDKYPQHVVALVNLGSYFYTTKRDYQEALRLYLTACRIDPSYAMAHFNAGCVYDVIDDSSNAISYYKKAISLNPQYADPCYNLGLLYFTLNTNPKEAKEHFEKFLQLTGSVDDKFTKFARNCLDTLNQRIK